MTGLIYEQPLNERMRMLLRLEHLFDQLNHYLAGESSWDNRKTITTLIDILNLLERADLKTELMKELDRLSVSLARLKAQPDVDSQQLDTILNDLQRHHDIVKHIPGRLGDELRFDTLIGAVKQRIAIPGGSCCFDLPGFHYWLAQPNATRNKQLKQWVSVLNPIESTVRLLLELIRSSAYTEKATAKSGFYQKMLEATSPCQLIRVQMNGDQAFPEISGGKHRISIRFLSPDEAHKADLLQQEIHFEIGCCII
jgi:cell division protein ZapD